MKFKFVKNEMTSTPVEYGTQYGWFRQSLI